MFSVKFKIKDGRNSLPRSSSRSVRRGSNTSLNTLKSSTISSTRQPLYIKNSNITNTGYNSNRKDKKVRIVVTNEHSKSSGNFVLIEYLL